VPELPEVETIRRQLEPLLVGARLVDAWAFPSGKFTPAIEAVGTRVRSVGRRGKYLLVGLDRDGGAEELVIHLGMTGRLSVATSAQGVDGVEGGRGDAGSTWARSTRTRVTDVGADAPDAAPTTSHLRARWTLDDGRWLLFDDVRRFGRIAVVAAGEHGDLPTLAALGPEPFDDGFSPEHLREQVNRSARALKTQLLSQRVVAGVGNIYADEALWRAGVHPASRRLTRAGASRLRDAVRDVLREGIDHGGTTLRNYRDAAGGEGTNQRYLDCYGRGGEPCVRCGDELRRSVIDARATVHCPTCQRRGG
jgi:formamidopyrimidine-DNA glycosylase